MTDRIYIVVERDLDRYAGFHFHKVFSTREKASKYIEKIVKEDKGLKKLVRIIDTYIY